MRRGLCGNDPFTLYGFALRRKSRQRRLAHWKRSHLYKVKPLFDALDTHFETVQTAINARDGFLGRCGPNLKIAHIIADAIKLRIDPAQHHRRHIIRFVRHAFASFSAKIECSRQLRNNRMRTPLERRTLNATHGWGDGFVAFKVHKAL
jgi:hypothetical protein